MYAIRSYYVIHADVIRPYSHSLSDDEVHYKSEDERAEEAQRDPVVTFPARLVREGVATEAELEEIQGRVEESYNFV